MSDQPKTDHPAPWTWNWRQDRGEAQPHPAGWVTDANGRIVLSGAEPASPLARELVRASPEMEALLRELAAGAGGATMDQCPWCDAVLWKHREHEPTCRFASILSALDAARKESR